MNHLIEAKEFLISKGIHQADAGIELGTGLHHFIDLTEEKQTIPYADISHFRVSTVEFHKGNLIYGNIGEKKVLIMQGRFHAYEGYSMQQIVFPIRVVKLSGIKSLLLSNATGGINLNFKKGDLVLINDHINLQSGNALTGKNFDGLGGRFPDMSEPYNTSLSEILKEKAIGLDVALKQGVYAANHMQLSCAAISIITDECDPDNLKPVNIAGIIAVAGKADKRLSQQFYETIKTLA